MTKQKNDIIGIYKITSPSNKVYIGQSRNYYKRWLYYINLHCKKQIKLYNSFIKYGVENHTFIIIEKCYESQLDKREAFHKRKFIKENGWEKALFCQIKDGEGKKMSQETKDKISKFHKGKKYLLGFKFSNEQKKRISDSKKGCKYSKESGLLKSKATKGKPKPKGFGENAMKSILQYDKQGNFIKEWNSITEADKFFRPNRIKSGDTIGIACRENKRTAYGYKWKFKN